MGICKMKSLLIYSFIIGTLIVTISCNGFMTQSQCHPQCSWKCDDPHCPAICDPVCEPPKCHTSCAEPKNAICDVKCEKPECEIKCPDKGCEMFDCPKCVTVCKQPHCVTHCQAPKPECEPVCEEPKCDWKCHKPACPKPKCELVCENPNCVPKVECCPCALGAPRVAQPFPFFKETEEDKRCCGCDGRRTGTGAPSDIPQVVGLDKGMTNETPIDGIVDTPSHVYGVSRTAKVNMLRNPVALGTGQFTGSTNPNYREYKSSMDKINLDMAFDDKR